MIEAAAEPGMDGKQHVRSETADLVFHLLVLLRHCGVALDEVAEQLAEREGHSGLQEKRARRQT